MEKASPVSTEPYICEFKCPVAATNHSIQALDDTSFTLEYLLNDNVDGDSLLFNDIANVDSILLNFNTDVDGIPLDTHILHDDNSNINMLVRDGNPIEDVYLDGTSFEGRNFNLENEFPLVNNINDGNEMGTSSDMQVDKTFQDSNLVLKQATNKTKNKHRKGPKPLNNEELDSHKNKPNVIRCRNWRKQKSTKITKEKTELQLLEEENRRLKEEEKRLENIVTKSRDAYINLIKIGHIKFF